jgi:SAM-dependent methyltransferase
MNASRRNLAAAAVLLPLLGACAQFGVPAEPRPYKPMRGQSGKDVIWIPTPDNVVERMLDMAQVKAGDTLVDLGSGDGKIAIAAAKRGARARGIEFNPDMVELSKRSAQEQGVVVDFVQGDIFASDFSDADVVTLYLLPELNERLLPVLLKMKPGTRVASHEFDMGNWKPERLEVVDGRRAYFWIVPAKVAGVWALRVEGEPVMELHIDQHYQQLEGHVKRAGNRVALADAALRGAHISFQVPDPGDRALRFDGTADHDGRMSGTAMLVNGQRRPFEGIRAR